MKWRTSQKQRALDGLNHCQSLETHLIFIERHYATLARQAGATWPEIAAARGLASPQLASFRYSSAKRFNGEGATAK